MAPVVALSRGPAVLAVLAFVSLGLPDGVLGVAWPSMRRSFGLPWSDLGTLLAASMLGYLVSSFSSGVVLTRLGVGRLLAASSALTAGSALACAAAPAWPVVVTAGLGAGLGGGAIDAGINAFAAVRFPPRLVSWLHASYGVGATAGPLLVSGIVAGGGSWRGGYAVVGLTLAALTAGFVGIRDRWPADGDVAVRGDRPGSVCLAEALRHPAVWRQVALFFVYTGLEVGTGQWAFSLLHEARGVPMDAAGIWVGAYWASLTVGRVALGGLTARVSPDALLRVAFLAGPGGAALLWAGGGPAAGGLGLVALGLAFAPIYPLLIATTPSRVGVDGAAHAVGLQVGAAYVGAACWPGAAGLVVGRVGLEALGPFLAGTAVALLLLSESARWRTPAPTVVAGADGSPGGARRV